MLRAHGDLTGSSPSQVLFDKWPSVLTQVIGLFSVSATKKSQNYKGSLVQPSFGSYQERFIGPVPAHSRLGPCSLDAV